MINHVFQLSNVPMWVGFNFDIQYKDWFSDELSNFNDDNNED